ncbi:MAG: glycosyltransferase family 39 protein [Chloroflexota bacterium]
MDSIPSLTRQDLCWLLGLVILAGILRLPGLGVVPPGFQFDETYNALDALELLQGRHRLFLRSNAGREVLYTYWQAPYVALLGPTSQACRLPSAVAGTVTVAVLYVIVWHVSGQRELAVISAACLALSYWHLHFSRYGIRSILVPLWMSLAWYAFWRALATARWRWFAWSGLFLAAAIWTHPAGRIAPVLIVGYAALVIWAKRHSPAQVLGGLALTVVAGLVLSAPLLLYFWRHPVAFYGHISDVAVTRSGTTWDALRRVGCNAVRVLGAFTVRGSEEWIHNLPGRPVFDPLLSLFFVLGLGATIGAAMHRGRPRRDRILPWMLLVWMAINLPLSVFSDMAPNYSRTIGVLPSIMVIVGSALAYVWRWLRDRVSTVWAMAALGTILAISGGFTTYDYFVRFGQDPRTSYHYDKDKIEAAEYLLEKMDDHVVYLSRLWARQATIRLLTRDADLRTTETDAAVVLPSTQDGSERDKDVLYAYPAELRAKAQAMYQDWRPLGARLSCAYDERGKVLLYLVSLPAALRPPPDQAQAFVHAGRLPPDEIMPLDVTYGEGIRLLGYAVSESIALDGTLEVTLVWECVAPMEEPYTAYVHLLGPRKRRCGQMDEQPGRASYPTTSWRTGDVVIDRHLLSVDPTSPPGTYSLELGLYHAPTGQHLLTAEGGRGVRLPGPTLSGMVALSQEKMPDNTQRVSANELGVLGVVLPEGGVDLQRPFQVSLIMDREALEKYSALDLALQGADEEVWAESLDISALEVDQTRAERVVVTASGVIQESGALPGSYAVVAQSQGTSLALGEVELRTTDCSDELPKVDVPLNAVYGGAIRLAGLILPGETVRATSDGAVTIRSDEHLKVTLIWQALVRPDDELTVFVHLLDAEGQVVAQHDGVPVEGTYPTISWVPDEVVMDEHSLNVPRDLDAGPYTLAIGLYDALTSTRPETVVEGRIVEEGRVLVPVRVEGGG